MNDVARQCARLMDAAATAVSCAAIVCRYVQSRLGELQAMTKDDRSPVTIADFASQAVVARVLSRLIPQINGRRPFVLVAEESADFLRERAHAGHLRETLNALDQSGAWARPDADEVLAMIDAGGGEPASSPEHYWTLDPIDGTKGFLRGEQYCVSLAQLRGVRNRGSDRHVAPMIGALACPNLSVLSDGKPDTARGALFTAMAGFGAGVQALPISGGPATEPHPPTAPRAGLGASRQGAIEAGPLRAAISVDAGHSDASATARLLARVCGDRPGAWTPVRMDSQCKYAVVARGEADVYLRLPTRSNDGSGYYVEKIWDHAAGSLIAAEAGCVVTDSFGRALDFARGRELTANRGVVCASPRWHTPIIEAIAALGIGRD